MSKLILLIGFQASTKSCASQEINEKVLNSIIISRDEDGGKIENLLPKVEKNLLEGKIVIIDNTNLTKQVRKQFIDIAKKLKIPVEGQYFKTTIEDCQIRHLIRMYNKFGEIFQTGKGPKYFKDPHCYGPVVLFKARKDLEEPEKSEGFRHVIMRDVPPIFWNPEVYVNKALFLDVDGTLRKTEHLLNKYPLNPDEVELLHPVEEMRKKLEEYRAQGYRLIGVSNQSGVSRGTITMEKAEECFERTRQLLGYTKEELPIMFCPHRSAPIICFCRKPQVGLPLDCIMKYKMDPKQCIMVGDQTSDKTMAARLQIKYYDVKEFWH